MISSVSLTIKESGTYLRPATLQKADMVLDDLDGNVRAASEEVKWKND